MSGLEDYIDAIPERPTIPPNGRQPRPPVEPKPRPSSSRRTPAPPPPAGFSESQWRQLTSMSRNNPALAALISQFTGSSSTPQPSQAWRRENPTSTSQLLRQLSFNVGETGMPGGYVGAVQLPSYGSGAAPVNNPDMRTYGRTPNLGEATFYRQSMKGGMTPIAAMSPMGVPEGWNPGGTSTDTMRSQLEAYLRNIGANAGGTGGGTWTKSATGRVFHNGQPMPRSAWATRHQGATPAPAPAPTPAPQPFPISGGTPITPPFGTI